jgi:hypothetical protein
MHNFLAATVLLLPNVVVPMSSLVQLSRAVIENSLGKLNLDTSSWGVEKHVISALSISCIGFRQVHQKLF